MTAQHSWPGNQLSTLRRLLPVSKGAAGEVTDSAENISPESYEPELFMNSCELTTLNFEKWVFFLSKTQNESCFVSVTQASDARASEWKSYSRRSSRHVITKVFTIAEKHWHFCDSEYLTPIMLLHTLAAVVISILISLRSLLLNHKEIPGGRSMRNQVVDRDRRELDVFFDVSSLLGQVMRRSREATAKCQHNRLTSQPSLSRCLKSRLTLEGFLH